MHVIVEVARYDPEDDVYRGINPRPLPVQPVT
jgi:hypothetical protein